MRACRPVRTDGRTRRRDTIINADGASSPNKRRARRPRSLAPDAPPRPSHRRHRRQCGPRGRPSPPRSPQSLPSPQRRRSRRCRCVPPLPRRPVAAEEEAPHGAARGSGSTPARCRRVEEGARAGGSRSGRRAPGGRESRGHPARPYQPDSLRQPSRICSVAQLARPPRAQNRPPPPSVAAVLASNFLPARMPGCGPHTAGPPGRGVAHSASCRPSRCRAALVLSWPASLRSLPLPVEPCQLARREGGPTPR